MDSPVARAKWHAGGLRCRRRMPACGWRTQAENRRAALGLWLLARARPAQLKGKHPNIMEAGWALACRCEGGKGRPWNQQSELDAARELPVATQRSLHDRISHWGPQLLQLKLLPPAPSVMGNRNTGVTAKKSKRNQHLWPRPGAAALSCSRLAEPVGRSGRIGCRPAGYRRFGLGTGSPPPRDTSGTHIASQDRTVPCARML